MTERSAPPHTLRRILVALDASPHSREALELSVTIAADVGAEVVGVFVEDATALRAARLPFVQEVRSYQRGPQTLSDHKVERQMRRQAEEAEDMLWRYADPFDVPHSFEVLRGAVTEELLAASARADLLALGKTSTDSSRRQLGSSAHAAVTQGSTPVLVVRRLLPMPRPVLTYYDGTRVADDALGLAVHLACRIPDVPLKVLLPSDDAADVDALRSRVRTLCASASALVDMRPLSPLERCRFGHAALKEDGGLVVLPAPMLEDQPRPVDRLLYDIDTPVLVVR